MPRTSASTDLQTTLEAKAAAPAKGGPNVFQLIESQRKQVERALPKTMSTERFMRVVLTEVRRNPKLGECDPASFLGAMMLCAQLGLEPGPLGQAYLVPFGKEVQFIVGYKGLINLALRSDKISSIEGHEIYDNDTFDFNYGTGEVNHTFVLTRERGPVIGFWAKAQLANGAKIIRVLTLEDIEARRKRSKAKDSGPWATDYIAMGIKTAIRTLCSQLPLAIEAERAILADDHVADIDGSIIDIDEPEVVVQVDQETGEVAE